MKNMRLKKIMELVNRDGSLTVEKAIKLLNSSAPTIRRDFNELAETGEVNRHYGGITRNVENSDPALPYALRENWCSDTKKRLAKELLHCLPEHGVIFVDGGTTTAHLGMFLKSMELRIITNSLALYRTLDNRFPEGNGPKLMLTGGEVNRKSAILLGPEAVNTIKHFYADVTVISGTAIDDCFLYDNREDAAELQRNMIANARELIIIADSSKVGRTAMCRVEPVEKITHLITNFCPENHDIITKLRKKGVKVSVLPEYATKNA